MTAKPITVSLNSSQWELLELALRDYHRIVRDRIASGDFTHGLGQADRLNWILRYLEHKAMEAQTLD